MQPRPRKTSLRSPSHRGMPAREYGSKSRIVPKPRQLALKRGKITLAIPDPAKKTATLKMPGSAKATFVCLGAANISGSRLVVRKIVDWRNREIPTKEELRMLRLFAKTLKRLGWSLETR